MFSDSDIDADSLSDIDDVVCDTFVKALNDLEEKSDIQFFTLKRVPPLSKHHQIEYEACSKFCEAFMRSPGISNLYFEDMRFHSDLVGFISKVLSDYEGFNSISFKHIKFDSPETAIAVGEALKRRPPNENLSLFLQEVDERLFEPLMETSAVIGAQIDFKNLDLTFVDTRRCLRRWTVKSPTITHLQLKDIRGLSEASLMLLMKGVRNVSNLSVLSLNGTKCSPGSLIMLKESISLLLKRNESNKFHLGLKDTGMNDAALWKITELFLEHNEIVEIDLSNVQSSVAPRLISARVITNQSCKDIKLHRIKFVKQTDFNLLFFALKIGRVASATSLFLTADLLKNENMILIKQLPRENNLLRIDFTLWDFGSMDIESEDSLM